MFLVQVSQKSYVSGQPKTVSSADKAISPHISRSSMKIPQLDGPIPDPYDDVLSTPNVSIPM